MSSEEQYSDATPISNAAARQQTHTLSVRPARTRDDVASFAMCCAQYADWLMTSFGMDISFQGVQEEMNGLPGDYAPPEGTILLASAICADGTRQDVGGVALRPLNASQTTGTITAQTDVPMKTCEMKRLYVLPGWQQCVAGKLLTQAAIQSAKQMGYQRLVLDSVKQLLAANKMYAKLQFRSCKDYNRYHYPFPDVCFWEMLL